MPMLDAAQHWGREMPMLDAAQHRGREIPMLDAAQHRGREMPMLDAAQKMRALTIEAVMKTPTSTMVAWNSSFSKPRLVL